MTRTNHGLTRFALVAAIAGVLAAGQMSCAVSGLTPDQSTMPAARASLRPEYRLFYDALVDYGEWILVEPFGFLFRPRVAPDFWNPYWDGYWSPTDQYGWVWVSAEPFGWATYHYGRWYRDPYQGWVWIPGLDWAPAWVTWSASDDYVGWAPLGPASAWTDAARGATYQFVPRAQLGSTNLKTAVVRGANVEPIAAAARPVENLEVVEGVTINTGPRIEWVERVAGPLQRARLDDVLSPQARPGPAERPGGGARATDPAADAPVTQPRRAAEIAARRTRDVMQKRAESPPTVPVVRPDFKNAGRTPAPAAAPGTTPRKGEGRRDAAPPDSARR